MENHHFISKGMEIHEQIKLFACTIPYKYLLTQRKTNLLRYNNPKSVVLLLAIFRVGELTQYILAGLKKNSLREDGGFLVKRKNKTKPDVNGAQIWKNDQILQQWETDINDTHFSQNQPRTFSLAIFLQFPDKEQ